MGLLFCSVLTVISGDSLEENEQFLNYNPSSPSGESPIEIISNPRFSPVKWVVHLIQSLSDIVKKELRQLPLTEHDGILESLETLASIACIICCYIFSVPT